MIQPYFTHERGVTLYCGDALAALSQMPSESVQCVVTSPPYWALRDYGVDGQLGLEPAPEEYIAKMVAVFREVRRVLMKDGTCWLNIGDSYAGSSQTGGTNSLEHGKRVGRMFHAPKRATVKPKDLCMIPARLALALQADGWYLRSDIIWHKQNPMPESCQDRPTSAHEHIFLLTKAERYFYDAWAVRTEPKPASIARCRAGFQGAADKNDAMHYGNGFQRGDGYELSNGANLRNVWQFATQAFPEAHFATFPEELARRCILLGTSEWGACAKCGVPWRRVIAKRNDASWKTPDGWDTSAGDGGHGSIHKAGRERGHVTGVVPRADRDPEYDGGQSRHGNALEDIAPRGGASAKTVNWQPACRCDRDERVPCVVLDPFNGAGTTGLVALQAGRHYVGIDLNAEYLDMSIKRLQPLLQQEVLAL